MRHIDWLILAVVIAAFWVFDVFVVILIDSWFNQYVTAMGFGLCIGQINLIGAWAALAPGKVIVRLPWAILLGVVMWQAVSLGQYVTGGFSGSDRLTIGLSIGFGVVTTQIPLWFARWPFGWRLLPPRFDLGRLDETDMQFNLKHLFLGILVASLALGIARATVADVNFSDFGLDDVFYVVLPVAAVCNALVTAPCIWIAYWTGKRLVVGAIGWVFYAVVVSVIELFALTLFLGPPGGDENSILVFSLLNLAQCLTVFGTMLLLRGIGFRLIRTVGVTATTEDTEPECTTIPVGRR